MSPSEPVLDLFKGRHFDREAIVLCMRWYLSYKLKLARPR
jgi:transposase-like protein